MNRYLLICSRYLKSQDLHEPLLNYKRDLDEATEKDDDLSEQDIQQKIKSVINGLDLDKRAYTVSPLNQLIRSQFAEINLTNRKVKTILIECLGEDICFTYPRDKRHSQMFFRTRVSSEDIVESLRIRNNANPIKNCAEILEQDCKNFFTRRHSL